MYKTDSAILEFKLQKKRHCVQYDNAMHSLAEVHQGEMGTKRTMHCKDARFVHYIALCCWGDIYEYILPNFASYYWHTH